MRPMSTERLPQHTGFHLLPDGTDHANRPVAGNVVIVEAITVDDPADVPLGRPAELGVWGEALWIEDPGGRRIRALGAAA
jgi:hypothetical protein